MIQYIELVLLFGLMSISTIVIIALLSDLIFKICYWIQDMVEHIRDKK